MSKPIFFLVENDDIKKALWRLGLSAGIANGKAPPLGGEQVAILQRTDDVGTAFVEHAARVARRTGYEGALIAVPIDSTEDLTKERLRAAWRQRAVVLPDPEAFVEMMERSAHSPGESQDIFDLFDKPEVRHEWTIDGLLPVGGILLASARMKAGKSTFCADLAACVASGRQFLGREVSRGKVLWLAFEEAEADVVERFRSIGGLERGWLHIFADKAPQDAWAWLDAEIQRVQPVLLVVDTWQRLTRVKNINDYSEVTAANEPLLDLRRHGLSQLWLHHNNKSDGQDGREILGSVALAGAADNLLLMSRMGDGMRTIRTIQRVGDDMEETVVLMNDATRRMSVAGSKYIVQVEAAREKIREALGGQNDSMTSAEIVEATGGRRNIAFAALGAMKRGGEIAVVEGTGKRGSPSRYALASERVDSLIPIDSDTSGTYDTGDTGNSREDEEALDLLGYADTIT